MRRKLAQMKIKIQIKDVPKYRLPMCLWIKKKVDNYVLNHYDVRNVLTLILLSNVLEL